LTASLLPDNWYGTLTNTSGANRTVAFSGFNSAVLRDGTNTPLGTPLTIPTGRSIRVEAVTVGANRHLNVANYAPAVAARGTFRRLVAGNKGTTVDFNTLRMGVAASGNASMVIASSTGLAISFRWASFLTWNSAGTGAATITATMTHLVSGWNLTAVNDNQTAIIEDLTNLRTYKVQMITQPSHNNNIFFCEEL
jgi:hypothetical protein